MVTATTPCTHPGCASPVEVPPLISNHPVLGKHFTQSALCPLHEPDDEAPAPGERRHLSVEDTWARRVPTEIINHYGQPPSLRDLPRDVMGLESLAQIAAAWPGRWTPQGWDKPVSAIVLGGMVGALKTTTAYALLRDIMERSDRPDRHRATIVATSERDLLGDVINDRGWASPATPQKTIGRADVVLVDDVGYGQWNSATRRRTAWKSLMDLMYERGKFLILTTNMQTERELWDHIGPASFSRLAHMVGARTDGVFEPPTSDNPADSGYWPTPVHMLVLLSTIDRRMSEGTG